MPGTNIEGYEKGQPVEVVAGSEGNANLVGKSGVVSFCYASDVDGSPWVYVTVDAVYGKDEEGEDVLLSPGARTFAFRPDDLEAVDDEKGDADVDVEVPAEQVVESESERGLEIPS